MAEIRDDLTRSIFQERENDKKHPPFEDEMGFYSLIAAGKIDELREFRKGHPKSTDEVRGVLSDNPVRNAVYHFVAMITMVTRACMMNGLPQDVAYKMSDIYIRKADRLTVVEDILKLQEEMIYDFTSSMRELNTTAVHSKQIVQCIDYISKNLHNNITVYELAKYVDLNETYLSKLFKKEMGCPISKFIRDKKVEEAMALLRYSDKASIEIAADLGFSSHSYFISVFRSVTGETPKEYRNHYFRKL